MAMQSDRESSFGSQQDASNGLPDLTAFLNDDPTPTLIVPIDTSRPIHFHIAFGNTAFINEKLEDRIFADNAASASFRGWMQAVAHWTEIWEFENQSWSAFSIRQRWKVVKMANAVKIPRLSEYANPSNQGSQGAEITRALREASRADAQLQSVFRMMEMSDVGVFEYSLTGTLIRANDSWYRLSLHSRDMVAHQDFSFMDLVYPEDSALVIAQWNKLVQKEPVTFEMRWKAPLHPCPDNPEIMENFQWVLSACVPVVDDSGNLICIAGNTIDISAQKRIQEVQRKRVEEALEQKRRAQNFIDMTSHEMRNPLSAIIQCADSTIESLHQISNICEGQMDQVQNANSDNAHKEIQASLDALQTIISCSMHQKHVIDDILTLSKLDSNLILITPVRAQPSKVVHDAVKIFSLECIKEDIGLVFHEDSSLMETGAGWVMLDSSRLLQVLLNLLTNAIKFTRNRERKSITVTVGATPERPSEYWNGIKFAASRTVRDVLKEPDWGDGRRLYLWVAVEDTGCGLTPQEQSHLFARFTQATPRTHVTYGGSGLGLFISKSLADMHGAGCIGVRSRPGIGSTFAFFIGVRAASDMDTNSDLSDGLFTRPELQRTLSVEGRVKDARYCVLLVEDNLINQKVLAQQLERVGCVVHVAGHGKEALDFLKETKFWRGHERTGLDLSIVLMDIEMPIMDGITACRKIREMQQTGEIVSHIPIISVSANARSEQVADARNAGMDDSISKPFRIPELLPKIEMLARRWEA